MQEELQVIFDEIYQAEDLERTFEWSADPFRRLDAIVYHSPSLGKAVRERRIYRAVVRDGRQVGWAMMGTELEEVV